MNTKEKSNLEPINKFRKLTPPLWSIENPYLSILSDRFFSETSIVDWRQLPERVARLFVESEYKYTSKLESEFLAQSIYDLVHEGAFIPNSPVMMNSEMENEVNLFACHVLAPPADADDLSVASSIHDGCGGIGYDFSKMNDPVSATTMVENHTASLNSTRKRKAHSAVTLHINHPKVKEFINIGRDLLITHTNVELDDDFFTNIENKDANSSELWKTICDSIEAIGKPAIAFASNKNMRSANGEPLILNVCGESLLRENESSIIGTLNLTRFVQEGTFDYANFEVAARLAVRCLDNFHDHQNHASELVAARCKESRKIGVGVMGYADALLMMGIRYGSNEAIAFTNSFMKALQQSTLSESEILASERGSCALMLLPLGSTPRRNASLMAIPANGTLSLIGNVTGGMEPIFSFLTKKIIEGEVVYQLQPTLHKLLINNGCDLEKVISELNDGVPAHNIKVINADLRKILVTANELTPTEHIMTQATFQQYVDGGISKTINLHSSATSNDIGEAILLAKEKGCVGISLYRNGSLDSQPMQMTTKT